MSFVSAIPTPTDTIHEAISVGAMTRTVGRERACVPGLSVRRETALTGDSMPQKRIPTTTAPGFPTTKWKPWPVS